MFPPEACCQHYEDALIAATLDLKKCHPTVPGPEKYVPPGWPPACWQLGHQAPPSLYVNGQLGRR